MTATQRRPLGHDLLEGLASNEALDPPAAKVGQLARDLTRSQPLKDLLSGVWLGHPIHPLLIAVPLGSWTSAVLLDLVGGRDSERAADLLIAAGLLSAVPTVATGYSDWGDTELGSATARRLGIVHAACNATSAVLFTLSLAARARGARGRGKLLGLLGYGAVSAGGYLGGHLSYAEGVGVNETTFERYPQEWTRALGEDEVGEGEGRKVRVDGVDLLVARHAGEVHALSNTCCHRGGPLDEGELRDGTVTCPWHASTFRLADGSVERGPAVYPQPALETRVVGGVIEVRAPQRP